MTMTTFEAALVIHLIADWLLQNEWMAANKSKLSHPAAWIHSAIHGVLLGLLFGWVGGLVQAVLHMLVDTRVPLQWWVKNFKRCQNSPDYSILLIGCDQVLHVCCLAGWIALAGRWQ